MNVRTLAVLATLASSAANAAIVNISSAYGFSYDGGGSDPAPVPGQHLNLIGSPLIQLNLGPGNYEITNGWGQPGALYSAWSYNGGVNWVWVFVMVDSVTSNTIFYSEAGAGSSAAQVAGLLTVQNFSRTFTLALPATVGFTLRDSGVGDNQGGISLNVNQLDAPVPEPSTVSLLLTAGAIGCFLRRVRSSRS